MRFTQICQFLSVETKTTKKEKEITIMRVGEPPAWDGGPDQVWEMVVMGAPAATTAHSLQRFDKIALEGRVDSVLNDRGYIQPSFRIDRIEVLAASTKGMIPPAPHARRAPVDAVPARDSRNAPTDAPTEAAIPDGADVPF